MKCPECEGEMEIRKEARLGLDVEVSTCPKCGEREVSFQSIGRLLNKPCDTCQGDGVIEVCPRGHTTGCDCDGRTICCPDCDGSGTGPPEDEDEET
jgi:hypothetical protein